MKNIWQSKFQVSIHLFSQNFQILQTKLGIPFISLVIINVLRRYIFFRLALLCVKLDDFIRSAFRDNITISLGIVSYITKYYPLSWTQNVVIRAFQNTLTSNTKQFKLFENVLKISSTLYKL